MEADEEQWGEQSQKGMLMLPIVCYISVVSFYMSIFEEVFSRPQLGHFGEYVTGLMLYPKRTVRGSTTACLHAATRAPLTIS
ncbi:MAG: hypothetical protein ACUVQM_05915 [Candidatus Hadarchaeaceae archaeon]